MCSARHLVSTLVSTPCLHPLRPTFKVRVQLILFRRLFRLVTRRPRRVLPPHPHAAWTPRRITSPLHSPIIRLSRMINARDGHLGSAEPRALAGTASPYHAGVSARRLFYTGSMRSALTSVAKLACEHGFCMSLRGSEERFGVPAAFAVASSARAVPVERRPGRALKTACARSAPRGGRTSRFVSASGLCPACAASLPRASPVPAVYGG